jgi:hypothetical protein
MYLSLILSCNFLYANPISQAASNHQQCIKTDEVQLMGKQINELLKQEFCEARVDPKHIAPIIKSILPLIMTDAFLGAPPPENWQQLSDDIIKNCVESKDLCKREDRREFTECLKPRVPMILVQYAPWFAEHCSQLNKSLIQQWPNKKEDLEKMIKDNKRK